MIELLHLPFIQRALAAVILLSIATAVLGVFVVLRRMSFFADAISHASLAGIALGILLGLHPDIATICASLLVGLGIAAFSRNSKQSLDTVIGVFYSLALAIGVIILSVKQGFQVKIASYLFGDILTVDNGSLLLMLAVGILIVGVIVWKQKELVLMSLQRDLAKVQGFRVDQNDLLFISLLALLVAVGIKVAGIILVGPLLIIPAATAKNLARSLRETFVYAGAISLLSGLLGLLASFAFNLPSGPTIVALSGLFFFMSYGVKKV